MQSLDAVNGGDGVDTLSIVETGSVAKLAGTFTSIEKVVVQSGGSIGAAAANATVAQKQQVTYALTGTTGLVSGEKITVTVGANKTVLTIGTGGVTGAGKVSIGDITGAAKLTSVDASSASGGLVATVGSTGSYGLTLKGSSGADTITLKSGSTLAAALVNGANVTTSITLGAGNDTLLNGGSVTVGAGVTIDAGDGVDPRWLRN